MPSSVMAEQFNDRDMKSALIYNFSIYTIWPEIEGETFNVCTFEEDRENINENIFLNKKIDDKSIRYVSINQISQVEHCNVLYLEESKKASNQELRELVEKYSVLMVRNSDVMNFPGSMISMELQDKKYHFSVNNQLAKLAKISFSSKLLRLADKVY